jgi:very-short-patch-repair endonuclease
VWLDGLLYYVDIAFKALRIAVEIDGYEVHRAENRDQFEHDRRKWSALTAAGWRVLHFTGRHLRDQPEWVIATIRRTVAEATAARRPR